MSVKLVSKDLTSRDSIVVETAASAPVIKSYVIVGSDDLALDTAGDQVIEIRGQGFKTGVSVILNNSSIGVVTFINSTTIRFTSPALSSGTYNLFVKNTDGGTAILVPGLSYSGLPTFTTSAGSLGSYYETTEVSEVIEATEGADTITYAVVSGSLPDGVVLSANGTISGTAPVDGSSNTYTFTIKATDEELQDSTREFSLTINTDVVTWSSPSENEAFTLDGNQAMSNITLSASSAAGYAVTYQANTLPNGVSLDSGIINGTPTDEETVYTLLTATSATTNRSATRTISFTVSLGDAYFNQTTLLLNGDVNTFNTDASTNSFAITPYGDVRPSAFSPYNTSWSNYFDGSGDYLSVNHSSSNSIAGDFTFECWANHPSDTPAYGTILGWRSAGGGGFILQRNNSNNLSLWISNSTITQTSATYTPNVWHHVAVTRSGSTVTLWVDGVSVGTSTLSGTISPGTGFTLGVDPLNIVSVTYFKGCISNARFVNGTAVYTTAFTPPTAPLTAITNTTVLTCQSNRLIDNSTNNFTITKNGDVKVTSFGPFIDTDTTTGSAYFDGSDYLSVAAETSIDLASSNFTIECWVYPGTQTNSVDSVFGYGGFTTMLYRNGTTWSWEVGNGSSANYFTITATLIPNAWQHIALTRYGNTFTFWINGALAGTNSTANAVGTASKSLAIGYNNNSPAAQHFTGYISNFRLVKGTAVYTAAFTPPTSPLTAIANTSLLTLQNRISYNNSQPIDESGVKNIITRNGNASVGTFSPHVPTGWSAKFNGYGTSESITCTTNSGIDFGSGDFTIEAWINYAQVESRAILTIGAGSGSDWLTVGNGALYWTISGVWNQQLSPNNSVPINEWVHVVFQRISGVLSTHINGVYQSGNTSNRTDAMGASGVTLYIGTNGDLIIPDGFITEVRIIKGEGVYGTSNFTPSTSPLGITSNTSFLWHGGELRDSISHGLLTKSSTVKIQPFSPFRPHTIAPNSYSVYFDGSGDYLNASYLSSNFGTGDFTIEAWIFNTVRTDYNVIVDTRASVELANPFVFGITTSGYLYYYTGTEYSTSAAGTIVPLNAWTHVAISRSGTTIKIFQDGVEKLSRTDSSNLTGTSNTIITVGRAIHGIAHFFGHMSNLRVVKGTAVYTANFTPPTAPLTAISGTSLLACQSPTVIDNSTNAFAITVNGNSQPTKFNPFGETVTTGVEYSPTTHGGSVYFDGTGDYLSLPGATSFTLPSTMNWTVECWIYPDWTPSSDYRAIFSTQSASGTSSQLLWATYGTEPVYLSVLSGGGGVGSLNLAAPNNVIRMRQWQHIALVNNGGTLRQYHNGVPLGSGTAGNYTSPTTITIGSAGTGSLFTGYIAGFNVLNGSAKYTAAFVPPAAPADPIPNTTLLVNGTNAAIQDRTGRNVLETVGNAQISTSVKKFGTGSLAFDGSGDYLVIPNQYAQFSFGTGDFTIEAWVYLNTLPAGNGYPNSYWIVGGGLVNSNTGFDIAIGSTNLQVALTNFASLNINYAHGMTTGTWYHIAVVRSGSTLYAFKDGVQLTTASVSGVSTDPCLTGIAVSAAEPTGATSGNFNGYIDDLRITKGVARYTSNFTPPTSTHQLK